MSDDSSDGLLPSGFSTSPMNTGENDLGNIELPKSVWLYQMSLAILVDGSTDLCYRLAWGYEREDGGEVRIDDEVWLDSQQMEDLATAYARMRLNETHLKE